MHVVVNFQDDDNCHLNIAETYTIQLMNFLVELIKVLVSEN